jgi:hypothetical protein
MGSNNSVSIEAVMIRLFKALSSVLPFDNACSAAAAAAAASIAV